MCLPGDVGTVHSPHAMKAKLQLFGLFLVLLSGSATAATVTNLSFGATGWKFFIGTQEASSPTDAWRATNFNDTSWSTGQAPLGYPSSPPNDPGGYETTIHTTFFPSSTAGSNYTTAFFRHPFVVSNLNAQIGMTIRIDDGYVIWINGTEIGPRYNSPGDP